MKEIMAVIRINKINETKQVLADAGLPSFTVKKVMGRGKGLVDYRILQGAKDGIEEAIVQLSPGPKFIPKRMLTLVVPDNMVKPAVRAIIKTNQTGNKGDGKIFVMPVLDAYRVRTGESGDTVLDEEVTI
jgi:nitrogen regulatory protein PII 2